MPTARPGPLWLQVPVHLGIDARLGECPSELDGGRQLLPRLQANQTQVLVRNPGEWALLVEDGRRATIEWHGDLTGVEGPAWIVDSWAVTIAMLQRGHLCLHASIVSIGDRVVAVAGESGAGKSTTAMALRARGHALLADDVAIIDLRDGEAWAIPFRRNVHLLPESADALGIDFGTLSPLTGFPEKSAFLPEEQGTEPRRLDCIVILEPGTDRRTVEAEELHGGERLSAVLAHAGRQRTSPAILGQQRYFELLAQLCQVTRVVHVRRPDDRWTLPEVVGVIEAAVGQPPP